MRLNRLLLFITLFCNSLAKAAESEDVAFFEKQIRPLLVAHCYECHSASAKIKGGLALDTKEGWEKGGDAGPAIIPGKPEESLFIKAIQWTDLDLQMPPKKRLAKSEQDLLAEWIRRGAPDPRKGIAAANPAASTGMSLADGKKFWSYAPLRSVTPPALNSAWTKTPVDQFILADLNKQGLKPSAVASNEALLRRLSFILTGLPPSLQDVQTALSLTPETFQPFYVQKMDTYLSSSAFAERWASHWLDLTRFAESSGGGRTLLFKDAWRFRDYIITSLHQNRPLNTLIREQIAGDLLPAASLEEKSRNAVATAFLALGPTIYEEQDKQRLRFDVIDEQIDTIGKAFLGQTLGCARCHDHKFDPVSQADYYALAGIFASTRTLSNYTDNVVGWMTHSLAESPEQEQSYAEIAVKLNEGETRLKAAKNELAKAEDTASGLVKKSGEPLPLTGLKGVVIDDTMAEKQGDWKQSKFSPFYFGQGYVHDASSGRGTKSLIFTPDLPKAGSYEVRLAYPALEGRAKKVPIHLFHAMGDVTVHVDQTKPPDQEGRFVSLGTYTFEAGKSAYVIISNEGADGYVVADLIQFLPTGEISETKEPQPDKESFQSLHEEIEQLQTQIKAWKATLASRPQTMAVREEDTIGDTEIRIRGEVNHRGAKVPRGYLSVISIPSIPAPAKESGRREFANWLVSDANPLTARVMANRIWAWVFGQGLVRTVDQFSTTGEAPSHPELLDYLARRLQEQNWNLRAMIRELLLSQTWQQSVSRNPQDLDNRWLSHAHSRRLDAEQLRDSMLVVSGNLDPKVGGPNIKGAAAFAPESAEASGIEFGYQFTDLRRSVYTPAFRNNRMEIFALFDFNDINTSQGKRESSTVAPQAHYFLNHPFVIDQAKAAAMKFSTLESSDTGRLDQLYLQALGRLPYAKERSACLTFLNAVEPTSEARTNAWATLVQAIYGSMDFRYLK
jgi:cytochrome c553